MPLILDSGAGDAIALEELIDALEAAGVDPRDEAGFAAWGPMLARLGRNPRFLADLAIAELKDRCAGQATASRYGAQVFLLRPASGRYVLRANFWPAARDAAARASGPAAFAYGMPHDHNFPFLTYGYLGPGYWSDYYEASERSEAVPGEPAGLTFVERARLEPGRLMLYRAHRDVHAQLPPDRFSVSLNILGADPAQPWRTQYRYDLARDRVAEALTTAPSEALTMLAAVFGDGNGTELAQHLAVHHPSARMRRTALDALATACDDADARAALYDRHADDPVLAAHIRWRCDRLRNGS